MTFITDTIDQTLEFIYSLERFAAPTVILGTYK
jgi:hypothetical protein